jgi:hypothetical protein
MPTNLDILMTIASQFGAVESQTDPGLFTQDTVPGVATVTGATNANPSVITTGAVHNFFPGLTVVIDGAVGDTAINGTWIILTTPSTTTFTIGVAGDGTWTSGGTVTPLTVSAAWMQMTNGYFLAPRQSVYPVWTGSSSGGASSGATFF